MGAPLGVRVCPELGCGRRIHVTPGGTVYARCVAHTLPLLAAFRPDRHDAQQGAAAASPRSNRSLPAGEPVAAGAMPR